MGGRRHSVCGSGLGVLRNPKFQAPSSKEARSSNFKTSKRERNRNLSDKLLDEITAWGFELGFSLELEDWDLVLSG
jgi:hypothetical protein